MQEYIPYSITAAGKSFSLSEPQVMGILNVTPDSFYAGSRMQTETEILRRAAQILQEGGTIIDIGAYSTRPGAEDITPEEEMSRLRSALVPIQREHPDAFLSIDTFRADVAKMCVEEYGVQLINDISGGTLDRSMARTIARLQVPYVLMHLKGTPQTMQQAPHYENVVEEVCKYFEEKLRTLQDLGVKDIILDPGFGFGKTLEHNYQLLNHLQELHQFHRPILVGMSRKSMIYQLLGNTPEEALNGTTVLNTISLLQGVHILRVHDVKACNETIKLTQTYRNHV